MGYCPGIRAVCARQCGLRASTVTACRPRFLLTAWVRLPKLPRLFWGHKALGQTVAGIRKVFRRQTTRQLLKVGVVAPGSPARCGMFIGEQRSGRRASGENDEFRTEIAWQRQVS